MDMDIATSSTSVSLINIKSTTRMKSSFAVVEEEHCRACFWELLEPFPYKLHGLEVATQNWTQSHGFPETAESCMGWYI